MIRIGAFLLAAFAYVLLAAAGSTFAADVAAYHLLIDVEAAMRSSTSLGQELETLHGEAFVAVDSRKKQLDSLAEATRLLDTSVVASCGVVATDEHRLHQEVHDLHRQIDMSEQRSQDSALAHRTQHLRAAQLNLEKLKVAEDKWSRVSSAKILCTRLKEELEKHKSLLGNLRSDLESRETGDL